MEPFVGCPHFGQAPIGSLYGKKLRPLVGVLHSAGQDRLKMGRLLLPRDHADFDLLETCILQPAVKVALGKTEPPVAIGFSSHFKVVPQKVQDQDLAVRAQ